MREQKLGPYVLQNVVGRGGMGTVYKAKHDETGETCAVKALAPTYAHDEHFRARFESEIQALLKLDHENIVRLISYGQNEGNLFFAMELVDGQSLFQMQRKGHRFDWREILEIAKDVGSGLKHAHDRGVIHRDLKPGNLLRAKSGATKITDFGIAKNFGTSQNTGDNVLGTMDFMSPEQAKGQPVTIRSDIYSLGTVMFTLLSGKPPFKANSVEESLRNLTKVPPPHVSSVAPDVPEEIDSLIRQMMDKRPEKRIQTAHALLVRIKEIENVLKNYSEAKTAFNPTSSKDTFVIKQTVSVPSTEKFTKNLKKGSVEARTIRHTTIDESKLTEKSPAKEQADYFNTVTEQQRARQTKHEDKKLSRGLIPLLVLFSGVLLLGGYGLIRAYSTPPADELYALIKDSLQSPDLVRNEIGLFIDAYPDDPRSEEVTRLAGVAKAIALQNKLRVQSRMANNKLSEVQKQFLDIASLGSDDAPAALAMMKAFLTLNSESEGLSDSDKTCVSAAKSYLSKLEIDATTKVEFDRDKIESALAKAAAEDSSEESQKIYASIVELYADADWARDLVEVAKSKLNQTTQNQD